MSALASVYVVSVGVNVEQVFVNREDAESFANDNPGARTSCRRLRQSMDEAVVMYDRRVIVANGTKVLDFTDVLREFVDDLDDTPGSAEVEWFFDSHDGGWHIVGFGTDKSAVDTQVESAINRFVGDDREPALESVGGATR